MLIRPPTTPMLEVSEATAQGSQAGIQPGDGLLRDPAPSPELQVRGDVLMEGLGPFELSTVEDPLELRDALAQALGLLLERLGVAARLHHGADLLRVLDGHGLL